MSEIYWRINDLNKLIFMYILLSMFICCYADWKTLIDNYYNADSRCSGHGTYHYKKRAHYTSWGRLDYYEEVKECICDPGYLDSWPNSCKSCLAGYSGDPCLPPIDDTNNLLVDGSFETPIVKGSYVYTNNVNQWSVIGGRLALCNNQYSMESRGPLAFSGRQYALLYKNSIIQQQFSTKVGIQYVLTYQQSTHLGVLMSKVDVLINSAFIGQSYNSDQQWKSVKMEFVSQTRLTMLIFKPYDGVLIDDVFIIEKPVDCLMSDWSNWSQCRSGCGWFEQQRSRSVLHQKTPGGVDCGPSAESRSCESKDTCPVDCVMGPWVINYCGCDGYQRNTRAVLTMPKNGGKTCGGQSELTPCEPDKNCTTCETEWFAWQPCGCDGVSYRYRMSPESGSVYCTKEIELRICSMGKCISLGSGKSGLDVLDETYDKLYSYCTIRNDGCNGVDADKFVAKWFTSSALSKVPNIGYLSSSIVILLTILMIANS